MDTTKYPTELWTGEFPGLQGDALELARSTPATRGKSFAEHWAETFAVAIEAAKSPDLIEPDPETVLDISPHRPRGSHFFSSKNEYNDDFEYSGFEPEPGVIYASITARQGGGNRECYCDGYDSHEDGCLALNNEILQEHPGYVTDFDDSFDSTYCTFIYRTELKPEDLVEFAALKAHIRVIRTQRTVISQINRGELAAWSILVANAELAAKPEELKSAKRDLDFALQRFDSGQLELIENILSMAKELKAGRTVDTTEVFDGIAERELPSKLGIGGYNNYKLAQLHSRANDLHKANRKLAKTETMIAEAEALPEDSVLREYLLGDRGQGSYNVQEKQGRRKVTVRKTYNRGTELGEKLKDAKSTVKSDLSYFSESLEPVKDRRKELVELQGEIAKLEKKVAKLDGTTWAAGWPGPRAELPPRPGASAVDEESTFA